ncbi:MULTISPECIES: GlxA family transcriptional regulator [Alcaligenes]|uniref:DJ-1/PfpI family protein n=1 Tax=Alcaligenes parafaecalis TaxID=171260 RepID=A0ABT3VIC1_9BURK|nr:MULTISPECIES: DJ-1/PfpI family protein [Alcaligenes]MCX5462965.1 DJ-1/PfpI family protein [Alcaligenes parafaecalis]QTC00390.1 DJ-1/PfpI family protein [Alcaligenes sp. SORT26]
MSSPLCVATSDSSALRQVVILVFEGVTLTDVSGISDVFYIASTHFPAVTLPGYQVLVASLHGGPVRTSCGVVIATEPIAQCAAQCIDTLVVPGGGPPEQPPIPPDLVAWLRQYGHLARRVCAVCTGAFLVAEAGLADQRRLTTHWQAAQVLAARYPAVRVEPEPVFVRDESLWSTAGFSAGVDMALALLEEDRGYDAAMDLARLLVVFLKRSSAQSQHSDTLSSQCGVLADFGRLHAWMADNLGADLSIEALAERVTMSPRTFARRYVESVGRTPAKTVELFRVQAAQRYLQEARLSLKQVAALCGFSSAQHLRRAFARHVGYTPD